MELFTLVTEFSRHFYAMLNREGVGAPLPNTSSAEKVIKIVGRLTEYGEGLTRKKNNLLAQERETSGSSYLFLYYLTHSCLFACLLVCLLACLLKSVFLCLTFVDVTVGLLFLTLFMESVLMMIM